ncbi:hypothetical protein, partial [Thiolapillus sp.]|uniref:hypothetical protein n=1 Tax=Thiolapillus sp. TaxID=2017437 RepID=UPI003AF967CB
KNVLEKLSWGVTCPNRAGFRLFTVSRDEKKKKRREEMKKWKEEKEETEALWCLSNNTHVLI